MNEVFDLDELGSAVRRRGFGSWRRALRRCIRRGDRGPMRGASARLHQLGLAPVEMVAKIEGEMFRREDLPRLVGRTIVRTAPTLRARVKVEDGLPREV